MHTYFLGKCLSTFQFDSVVTEVLVACKPSALSVFGLYCIMLKMVQMVFRDVEYLELFTDNSKLPI